jgi:hypothetical protein
MKLVVTGAAEEAVTTMVQYRRSKPVTYHGKVASSGQYVKSWKVPRSAPLGKAQVKVAIGGPLKSAYVTVVDFVVLK